MRKKGMVVLNDSVSVSCWIRGFTLTGAEVEFAEPLKLPETFSLLLTSSNLLYPARRKWQGGLAASVVVTGPGEPSTTLRAMPLPLNFPPSAPSRIPSNSEIRDAALNVWNEYGYAKTTLKQISLVVGTSEANILRRFGSKNGLILAAFEREAEEFCSKFQATGRLLIDLVDVVEAYEGLIERRGRLILEILLCASCGGALAFILPAAIIALRSSGSVIETYQASGVLKGNNRWEPLAALVGPLVLALLDGKSQTDKMMAEERVVRFLEGWRTD